MVAVNGGNHTRIGRGRTARELVHRIQGLRRAANFE